MVGLGREDSGGRIREGEFGRENSGKETLDAELGLEDSEGRIREEGFGRED